MAIITALAPSRASAYCLQFIPLCGSTPPHFVDQAVDPVKHRVGEGVFSGGDVIKVPVPPE